MNKTHTYNLQVKKTSSEIPIESHIVNASSLYDIDDPELLAFDVQGFAPAACGTTESMDICRQYVLSCRSRPAVANFFSKEIQDNDVQINPGSIISAGKLIVPVGGSLGDSFTVIKNAFARDIANILVLHTVHPVGREFSEEWITRDKAAMLGIPYINCTGLRNMVSCPGPANFLTRDKIYQLLIGPTLEDKFVFMHCLYTIYTSPSLEEVTEDAPQMIPAYNSIRRPGFPVVAKFRIPKLKRKKFKIPSTSDKIWGFYLRYIQNFGDLKGRGALSVGYARFDIPSADVNAIDEATDILMICRRYKYKAVTIPTRKALLFDILVKNGITVYTTQVQQVEKTKRGNVIPGVYTTGNLKKFTWNPNGQSPPKLDGSAAVQAGVLVYDSKAEPFFNYVYIPDHKDTNFTYIPCFNAASGKCIATNTKIEDSGVALPLLRARFARGIIFRSWFVYTRLTFVGQDEFREWFERSWIYPKRRQRNKNIDLFAGADEVVTEIIENEGTRKLYSSLAVIEALPTPAELDMERFEKYLAGVADGRIWTVYQQLLNNEFRFDGDSEMERIISNVDPEVMITTIINHCREAVRAGTISETLRIAMFGDGREKSQLPQAPPKEESQESPPPPSVGPTAEESAVDDLFSSPVDYEVHD